MALPNAKIDCPPNSSPSWLSRNRRRATLTAASSAHSRRGPKQIGQEVRNGSFGRRVFLGVEAVFDNVKGVSTRYRATPVEAKPTRIMRSWITAIHGHAELVQITTIRQQVSSASRKSTSVALRSDRAGTSGSGRRTTRRSLHQRGAATMKPTSNSAGWRLRRLEEAHRYEGGSASRPSIRPRIIRITCSTGEQHRPPCKMVPTLRSRI